VRNVVCERIGTDITITIDDPLGPCGGNWDDVHIDNPRKINMKKLAKNRKKEKARRRANRR